MQKADCGLKTEFLIAIRALAAKYGVERVYLFGSRARGDHRRASDIDIAAVGGKIDAFFVDLEEETPTLLRYDCVDLDGAVQPELLAAIEREGVILYEKIDNFLKSLDNLKDIYDYAPPYSNVEIAGLVNLYAICFEQAWKAMKEFLTAEGFPESRTGSPRQVIKTAFEAHLIDDEEGWLAALTARNNAAHAYNEDVALAIIDGAKERYYPLLKEVSRGLTEA